MSYYCTVFLVHVSRTAVPQWLRCITFCWVVYVSIRPLLLGIWVSNTRGNLLEICSLLEIVWQHLTVINVTSSCCIEKVFNIYVLCRQWKTSNSKPGPVWSWGWHPSDKLSAKTAMKCIYRFENTADSTRLWSDIPRKLLEITVNIAADPQFILLCSQTCHCHSVFLFSCHSQR